MARRSQLRQQRAGTVINATAKQQESELVKALYEVEDHLNDRFGGEMSFRHEKRWYLRDIVSELRADYPDMDFHHHFDNTFINPDGGILYINGKDGDEATYPILISEVKNQGTNDLRLREGKPRQARGNAIERLGKNLIGLRAALMRESIFPFVCFGYGREFAPDSFILDSVSAMAMFGRLNTTYLHNEARGKFNRGSFYFREQAWSVSEMADVMKDIAERSVLYYLSKYGESRFRPSPSSGKRRKR